MKKLVFTALFALALILPNAHAQLTINDNKSVAIISVDSRGISLDNVAMANLIRLELEKIQKYEVLDKYDVEAIMEDRGIDASTVFGKSQLVEVGKSIKADYMLTGSVQKFGSKTIVILRLVDVREERIIKSDVKEYVYDEDYLQLMARVSIASLFGLEVDPEVEAKLTNVDKPIITDGQTLKLSGPRFGMQFFSGKVAERLSAPLEEGGYAANPYSTVFAYQQEFQYVSSGEFQVLLECIASINGIETNYVSPSLSLLNGFRYKGWELGFGPVFRFSRVAEGYYDSQGKWNIGAPEEGANYQMVRNIDKRGDLNLSTGLVVAVGKTFRSGHINLPVNLYYSHVPTFDSHVVGFMLGFNIARSRK